MTAATEAQVPTFGFDAGDSSPTLAYGSNVAAGNLLVFAAVWIADTVPTITDSQGNAWQLCHSQLSYDSSQRAGIWSALAGSSGANTITFAKGAAAIAEYAALEYNWPGVVATPDATSGDTGSGVGSPSYDLITTADNELLVTVWRSPDGSQAIYPPWVNLGPAPSFQSYFYGTVAHQLDSGSAGTKAVHLYMGPLYHASAAVAFKVGGGEPPLPPHVVYPVADITTDSWQSSAGGALYPAVDEASPNSADYIYSPDNPTTQECELKFNSLAPLGAGDHTLDYQLRALGLTTVYRLTYLCGTTQIDQWTESVTVADGLALRSHTVLAANTASISDPTNMRIRIRASA